MALGLANHVSLLTGGFWDEEGVADWLPMLTGGFWEGELVPVVPPIIPPPIERTDQFFPSSFLSDMRNPNVARRTVQTMEIAFREALSGEVMRQGVYDRNSDMRIDAVAGGTGLDTSAATGVPCIFGGIWATQTQLGLSRGGTGQNLSTIAKGSVLACNAAGILSALQSAVDGQAPVLSRLPARALPTPSALRKRSHRASFWRACRFRRRLLIQSRWRRLTCQPATRSFRSTRRAHRLARAPRQRIGRLPLP